MEPGSFRRAYQRKTVRIGGTLVRECLAICESRKHGNLEWTKHEVSLSLAASLAGQGKYADAEQMLINSYTELEQHQKTLPKVGHPSLAETVDRLIDLYTAMNQPHEVAKWQQIREAISIK